MLVTCFTFSYTLHILKSVLKHKLLNFCYTLCKTENVSIRKTENSINISIFRKGLFFPVPVLFLEKGGWAVGSIFLGCFFLVYQINGSSWKPPPGKEEELRERSSEGSGRSMESSSARNGDRCIGAEGLRGRCGEKSYKREKWWCNVF